MKLALALCAACVLAAPGLARADVHLLLETRADQPAGSEFYLIDYADYGHFTANQATTLNILPQGVFGVTQARGLVSDDTGYHMLVSYRDDQTFGNDLYIRSYANKADMLTDTINDQRFLPLDIPSFFEAASLTEDNGGYHLLLQSRYDLGPGGNRYMEDFASYADLLNGNASSLYYLPEDNDPGFHVVAMLADHGAFHVLEEGLVDFGGYNDLYMTEYASLADLISGTWSDKRFLPQDIPGYLSVVGLALDPDPAAGPGGGGGVPEPAAWLLMILGFGGVGLAQRRRLRLA